MTLQWIPLEALAPHPENSNRMPPHLVEKLKGHIARTGRYEPLVVRPIREAKGNRSLTLAASRPPAPSRDASREAKDARSLTLAASEARDTPRYQILNGHHRARVLRDLGHTRARCDVWEVDDEEARLLLATLNRLEGRDDPSARAALVGRLAEGRSAQDLARLLPEPPDAVERLRKLAEPPPPPADPASAAPLPRAMTFFLDDDAHALVREALRATGGAARAGCGSTRSRSPGGGTCQGRRTRPAAPAAGSNGKGNGRAEALVRLAQWYLEARGRR